MDSIVIQIYEWLICLSEELLVYLLFRSKFLYKGAHPFFALAALPIMATFTFVMNLFDFPWALVVFICFCVHLAYAFAFFEGSKTSRALWGVVPELITTTSNLIYLIVFYVLTDRGGLALIPGNTFRVAGQVMYAVANYLILWPLMRLRNVDGELPSTIRNVSILLALAGVVTSMIGFSQAVSPDFTGDPSGIYILCSAILALSVFLLVFSGYLSRLYRQHLEAMRDLQQARLEVECVAQYESVYEFMRQWKHDQKDLLLTASLMAEKGQYAELKPYLQELGDAVDEAKTTVNTGNPAIDAIISSKLVQARQKGISESHTIVISKGCRVNRIDACSVLLNLLNNAIEAASALPAPDARIELNITEKPLALEITVRNSCTGEYKYDGNVLATTKDDKQLHGQGLARVRSILSAHKGLLDISPKADSFSVLAVLPLEEESK